MPQLQLPIFSPEVTSLTEDFAFQREDGKVVYFHGLLPVFQHDEKDLKSFRMFTSQLIANGTVRQRDIVRAFGVPLGTVKRYMKVHRQHGTAGFFRPQRRRSANVLTAEVKLRAQALIDVQQASAAVEANRRLVQRLRTRLLGRARRVRDLVQVQYEKGAASLLELLDAQRTWAQVHADYLRDVRDFWLSVFRLDAAVGRT